MLRKIYLSPLGLFISLAMNFLALFKKPFMVYGYFNPVTHKLNKKTRISSSVKLIDKGNINISDEVWIGHYSLLDGIGGIVIGRGVHIASHTCIYSHSSQNAIRLMGDKYIETPASARPGYIMGNVRIGDYTFIGTSSVFLPGTILGKGCIVGAGSVVKGEYPDYSVIVGNPAKVVGDSREIDKKLLADGLDFSNYYNKQLMENWKKSD